MTDDMTATPAQKKELSAEALKIAGFTENSEYPGVFTQEHGMKKIVKDLNVAGKAYFLVDKKKVTEDDEHKTLEKVDKIITEAEDGMMPSRTDADIVVTTGAQEDTPEQPDKQIDQETAQYIKDTKSLSDDDPAKVTAEMVNAPHEPTTRIDAPNSALVPLSTTTDIVRPAVSAQQAITAWNEFQDLKKAILQPSDLQRIFGKDFMKKSAWRKFATFFNLNDKIVEEAQTPHADGNGWTWKVKVECMAPNGRITEGVGMCSTSERNFTHLEHDTYAIAHTRAKNRAISDMVAAGEVSAEEVSA